MKNGTAKCSEQSVRAAECRMSFKIRKLNTGSLCNEGDSSYAFTTLAVKKQITQKCIRRKKDLLTAKFIDRWQHK